MATRRGAFVLTPPTMVLFVISVILAVLALLMHYAGLRIAMITPARVFDILAIAYLVLAAGVLFRQL
jgi:hypothetical protein